MDDLIDSIQKFNLNTSKNDYSIDFIINKMDNCTIQIEHEWDIFQNNYSKLKYFSELIEVSGLITHSTFINRLTFFIKDTIDPINERYLRVINWYFPENDDINERCCEIEQTLEESLNINNPVLKLKKVIYAYNMLNGVIDFFKK